MSVVGFLIINNTDIGELKFPLPPSIKLEPEETPHPFQYISSATDAGTFCRFHFSILTQIAVKFDSSLVNKLFEEVKPSLWVEGVEGAP